MVAITRTAVHSHRPIRSEVELTDPDQVGDFLDRTYGAKMRLRVAAGHTAAGRPVLRHTRTDAGAFIIEEVELPGRVEASPDPLDKAVIVWPTAGRVTGQCEGVKGRAGVGDIAMLSQPDLSYDVQVEDVTLTSVLLAPALLADVVPVELDAPIRFSQFEPVDTSAVRLWQETVDYVRTSVLADDVLATPLVLGHASRLLAAVTVAAFPGVLPAESPHDSIDAQPALLRRAVAFVDENVANDIALNDIAKAVHVSPRAVQYMFRRHLDTTPLQYLRRLRLDHAHRELVAANRADDTVSRIAAKWGFAHTGRFAVSYREAYGQSPHTTLRG